MFNYHGKNMFLACILSNGDAFNFQNGKTASFKVDQRREISYMVNLLKYCFGTILDILFSWKDIKMQEAVQHCKIGWIKTQRKRTQETFLCDRNDLEFCIYSIFHQFINVNNRINEAPVLYSCQKIIYFFFSLCTCLLYYPLQNT